MRVHLWSSVICVLGAFVMTGHASDSDLTQCEAGGVDNPVEVIAGCSAIIDKGIGGTDRIAYAHARRASAFLTQKRFDRAIADLNVSLVLRPGAAPFYELRGLVHHRAGQNREAVADYDMALGIYEKMRWPPHMVSGAFGVRAAAHDQLGNYALAIEDFSTALKTEQNNAHYYRKRGTAYLKLDRLLMAITDLSRAIELDPKDAVSYNNRCFARAAANVELSEALTDCNRALDLNPQPAIRESRGFLYLRLGQFEKAIKDFDATLAANPKAADALFKRGIAKRRSGEVTGGDADISAAKVLDAKIETVLKVYGLMP